MKTQFIDFGWGPAPATLLIVRLEVYHPHVRMALAERNLIGCLTQSDLVLNGLGPIADIFY